MPLTSLGGEGGSGKDSWKLLRTNKKQKGLGCFPCVNIWGGELNPRKRPSLQSLRREVESEISWFSLDWSQGGWGCCSASWVASLPLPSTRSGGDTAWGCGGRD